MKKFKSWKLKEVSYFKEETGSLSAVEYGQSFEFDIKRVFILNKFSDDALRGHHAHKELNQLVICTSGSFKINLDNGYEKESITLTDNGPCLYLDGMVWRTMQNFSKNCVVTVLCDREYKFDYVIRDYEDFIKIVKNKDNESI